jgi:hypothetical protein
MLGFLLISHKREFTSSFNLEFILKNIFLSIAGVLITTLTHAQVASPIFQFEGERAADGTYRIYNPTIKYKNKLFPIRVDHEAALALCLSKNPSMVVIDFNFTFEQAEAVSIYSDGSVYKIHTLKNNANKSSLPILSSVICEKPQEY